MNHTRRNITLVALLGLFSCTQAGDHQGQAASAAGQEEKAGPTNIVEIPMSVQRNLGITFAPVQLRRISKTLRIPGAFELQPLARQEYRMSLAGRVDIKVDEYQAVEADQILYRFQSPQWPELMHEIVEAEQAMESTAAGLIVVEARIAEARLKLQVLEQRITNLAKAEFKRADLELAAAELRASFPRLEAERTQALSAIASAERSHEHALHRASAAARVSEHTLSSIIEYEGKMQRYYETIEWIEVRADAAGVVEKLFVTNGAYVQAPDAVLSTVDPSRVRFRALALQADLPMLSGIKVASIVPPQSSSLPIGDRVPSDLGLGLEGMPRERFMTVFATPSEGRDWIRPGISAFLEIELDASAAQVLAIPRSAVLQDGLIHVFFRRNPKNPAQAYRVEADLGVDDGRWVEIKSGLMSGDEVVMQGVFELKLATERSGGTPKGGHFHGDGTFHEEEH